MAYNPALYNQYGMQPYQPAYQPAMQQPINGLVFIEKNAIDSYQMPAGSVSPPLFIDESHFIIKTFDATGGSATELYEAKKIPMSEIEDPHSVNVTKADLDAFKAEIMEAINGKHSLQDVQSEAKAAE